MVSPKHMLLTICKQELLSVSRCFPTDLRCLTYISYCRSPTKDDIRNNTFVDRCATSSTFTTAYLVISIHLSASDPDKKNSEKKEHSHHPSQQTSYCPQHILAFSSLGQHLAPFSVMQHSSHSIVGHQDTRHRCLHSTLSLPSGTLLERLRRSKAGLSRKYGLPRHSR